MTVRTRFAPSPTGYLHIGGVRTALFCWLFARRHGGQFILRIDDTDQQRNVAAALAPILHGFRWLGIDWDEGPEVGGPHAPYYQSQRGDRHREAVEKLLETGAAYYDYATAEEIQQERKEAERAKRQFVYSRRWMAQHPEDQARFEAEDRQAVVRLRMPREGKLILKDLIRGEVEFDWASEQDHVIQRADGSCLYHLATVVDDHDFQISHVIRAEEHLSNTPRQVFIAQALGYPLPEYAHLPYVAEPGSKHKLSKRKLDKYLKNKDFAQVNQHGEEIAARLGLETSADTFNPVIVDFYERVGYLPEAVVNYLLLLGWSLDDRTEFFTREAMIENFSLERVNRAPASFDPQKLLAFQQHYMNQLPVEQKVAMALPYLRQAGLLGDKSDEEAEPKVAQIVAAAGDRLRVAGDILDYDYFFTSDNEFDYDKKQFEKRLEKPLAVYYLHEFRKKIVKSKELTVKSLKDIVRSIAAADKVSSSSDTTKAFLESQLNAVVCDIESASRDSIGGNGFNIESLEEKMGTFVANQAIKYSDIVHAVRVALTGKAVGFGLFETMAILGRDACLRRIGRALKEVNHQDGFLRQLKDVPFALQSHLNFEHVNQPIQLYAGNLSLQQDNSEVAGQGTISLEWMPSATIRFVMNVDPTHHLELAESVLKIPEKEVAVGVFLTRIRSEASGVVEVGGLPKDRLFIGNSLGLKRLGFQLTNFHDFRGDLIKKQEGGVATWSGRAILEAMNWKIIIDSDADIRERQRQAAIQHGIGVTHLGSIKKLDGTELAATEIDEIIESLQYYLSFARGLWVAPILITGFDRQDSPKWEDWTIRKLDSWEIVQSWFPLHQKSTLSMLFAEFVKQWQSVNRKEVLRTAIYWYLASNSAKFVDRSLITSLIALEVLLKDAGNRIGLCSLSHSTFPLEELAAAVLKELRIPESVPEEARELCGYAVKMSIGRLPELLIHLRDACQHPNPFDAEREVHESGVLYQAWTISQWLVELLLLWGLNYDSQYANRVRARWVGEQELVPWKL